VNCSGRAVLKKGADVAVGRRTTERKGTPRERERKKTLEAQHWEEKERRCTVRLFRRNSLKEGAV
jgi:hypothetical protein